MMNPTYLVLKFYHYTPIEEPNAFQEVHLRYCLAADLRGRVKVASEGINGTVSGTKARCEEYMAYLKADPRFADMVFNITPASQHVHERMHVRQKREIVNSGLPADIQPSVERAGRCYITPSQFQKMRQEKDVVLVDVRSNYEHQLGKFEGALTFDIDNFRTFFPKARKYPFDKNKRHIVICTRGIKSEKARDFLRQELGLPKVYHLEGGILDFAQSTTGTGFEGKCYVFDNRLTVPINRENPTIISCCHHCQKPSARMVNCANPTCNTHVPMCGPCATSWQGACNEKCLCTPGKRDYNGTGYYVRQHNH